MPTVEDWDALRVRTGRVVRVEPNDGARDPSYRLWIDFGEDDVRQSSAKITERYDAGELLGRDVVAVTGFEPIRVAGFRSDVLVLGALTRDGVVLLRPDQAVEPGSSVA